MFENGFADAFLELAFVEVSSNGIDFARFPAVSLTAYRDANRQFRRARRHEPRQPGRQVSRRIRHARSISSQVAGLVAVGGREPRSVSCGWSTLSARINPAIGHARLARQPGQRSLPDRRLPPAASISTAWASSTRCPSRRASRCAAWPPRSLCCFGRTSAGVDSFGARRGPIERSADCRTWPPRHQAPTMTSPHDHNRKAWDARSAAGGRFTRPARDEEFRQSAGGRRCGGLAGSVDRGQARVVPGQRRRAAKRALRRGRRASDRRRHQRRDAGHRSPGRRRARARRAHDRSLDGRSVGFRRRPSFDIVIQPVSTCYVPDVLEVYRASGPGRRRPADFTSASTSSRRACRPRSSRRRGATSSSSPTIAAVRCRRCAGSAHREAGTLEFLHRWEELLGGMCRAGFAIEDVIEPMHADDDGRDRQLRPSQPLRRPLRAHQGPPRGRRGRRRAPRSGFRRIPRGNLAAARFARPLQSPGGSIKIDARIRARRVSTISPR